MNRVISRCTHPGFGSSAPAAAGPGFDWRSSHQRAQCHLEIVRECLALQNLTEEFVPASKGMQNRVEGIVDHRIL